MRDISQHIDDNQPLHFAPNINYKISFDEDLLSFAEIADVLKYSSVYSFSRAFKSLFEITTSAYKKQLKDDFPT